MANATDGLRQTIVDSINQVRTDSGRESLSASDSDTLTGELGLDSLDLAVLVVSLEKSLGVDPFRDGSVTARTLGELAAVYQQVKK